MSHKASLVTTYSLRTPSTKCPIELVDHTLSFLDTYSLERCTSGDPILSKLAVRYLYDDITLSDYPHPEVISRTTYQLTQILANKPEVAHYIRSLTIYLKDFGNSPLFAVSSLLPTFSQLTSVTLNGNRRDSSWDKLPEKFRRAFVLFLRAQVRELGIFSISSFRPSALDGCRELAVVTLDLCGELQYGKESMKGRLASPLLKHFAFRPCRRMRMEDITSWVQGCNLHTLKFTGAPKDAEHSFRKHLPPLLAACSHSLTNLCLDLKDKCEQEFHCMVAGAIQYNNGIIHRFPVNLAGLPHLEHLTICGFVNSSIEKINTFPISGIMELISTAAPSLKKISLCLELLFREDWLPFVPLAAQCSSLSVTVHVFIRSWLLGERHVLPWDDFRSPAQCVELKPYVESGLFTCELSSPECRHVIL